MFEIGKTYKTRDGRDAIVVDIDTRYPKAETMWAKVLDGYGTALMYNFHLSGRFCDAGESCIDLMPNPREWWVNFTEHNAPTVHTKLEYAISSQLIGHLETVHVKEVQ